ncbi:MAG TPA: hypothetical protein VGR89_16925, partial [Puia sp.]|nr:hypothetical protein [Puia sp.]
INPARINRNHLLMRLELPIMGVFVISYLSLFLPWPVRPGIRAQFSKTPASRPDILQERVYYLLKLGFLQT